MLLWGCGLLSGPAIFHVVPAPQLTDEKSEAQGLVFLMVMQEQVAELRFKPEKTQTLKLILLTLFWAGKTRLHILQPPASRN